MAVAKHLITASASVRYVSILHEKATAEAPLTFVHSRDSKADEDVAHNNHECAPVVISGEKARFIRPNKPGNDVNNHVDAYTRSIERHVTRVEGRILCLAKLLIIHSGYSTEAGLKGEDKVRRRRIRGAGDWIVLCSKQAAKLYSASIVSIDTSERENATNLYDNSHPLHLLDLGSNCKVNRNRSHERDTGLDELNRAGIGHPVHDELLQHTTQYQHKKPNIRSFQEPAKPTVLLINA